MGYSAVNMSCFKISYNKKKICHDIMDMTFNSSSEAEKIFKASTLMKYTFFA